MKELIKKSEELLNNLEFAWRESASAKDTNELLLRFAIYQYDIKMSLAALCDYKPQGFARRLALSKVAHSMFEFEESFNHHVKRFMLFIAENKESALTGKALKEIKKRYSLLSDISKFRDCRNRLTGHYDKDISLIVELANSINEKELLAIHDQSTMYYQEIINVLVGNKEPPVINNAINLNEE